MYPMACPAPSAAIARFLEGPGSKWLEEIPMPEWREQVSSEYMRRDTV